MRRFGWKMVLGALIGFSVLWMILGITVSARVRMEQEEKNRYYLEQERLLISELRSFLETKGFRNSGVTVQRLICKDGETTYTVKVHHGAMKGLSEQEQSALLDELSAFTFEDEEASFVHEILK